MGRIARLCVIVAALALIGSGIWAEGKAEQKASGKGAQVLDVLWHVCPAGRETSKLHGEFEKLFPGVQVKFSEISGPLINQKIALEWAAKTKAFDVVNTAETDRMWSMKAALSLNPMIEKDDPKSIQIDDILAPTKVSMVRDGQWLGLPVRNDTRLMYYNTRMFKNAGLDPSKRLKTFDETLQAALKLNDPAKDIAGFIVGYMAQYSYVWVAPYYIESFGGQMFDTKWHPTFNSPEGVRAMQFYVDLYRKHKVTLPEALNVDHPEQTTALLNARGAMNINVPARWADQFKPEFPKVKGDLTAAAPPGDKRNHNITAAWGLFVMADSDTPQLAYEYVKWASSTAIQKRIIKVGGDCNPTRMSVIADLEMQKEFPVFKALYDIGADAYPSPMLPESAQVGDIVSKYLRLAANGEMTAEAAVATASQKVDQLLQALGKY